MRKETTLTLEDRGKELTFHIKEMPATQLESWIMRALLLLSHAGTDLPAGDIAGMGEYLQKNGLAVLGGLEFEKTKPLLDELLSCCSREIGGAREVVSPETADTYIEDVKTLFTLRMEALKLNLSFFNTAVSSPFPAGVTIARHNRK